MHEMAVTQSLLNITLEYAQRANAVRVNELRIVVGELSSIVDDSVQFYWDFISQGTIAEKARLTFRRIPATMRCADCGRESLLNREEYTCPACGSGRLAVTGGEEFYLESIDVDLAEDAEIPQQEENVSHA